MSEKEGFSYRTAGVNIDAGAELVRRIKPDIARTRRDGVLGSIGGFGGLFELPVGQYKQPVLVSGADGVGTKLILANHLNLHDTIGIDLVAMCVNDILVSGAEPLYFLDYYACGKLDIEKSEKIIAGIADGCVLAGAALIGGESAEMPGMYSSGDYDLGGFAVGIVEKQKILDNTTVKPDDLILGLASSGCHSNGYSLVRKVLAASGNSTDTLVGGKPLGAQLMTPTRIYVKSVLALLDNLPVAALAHITGGGITENIPRSLPPGTNATIQISDFDRPAIFDWLQNQGKIAEEEMLRTFNCGIGMIAIVSPENEQQAVDILRQHGETVTVIGTVTEAESNTDPQVIFTHH
ncbi:phosphoribosylformylglycinamidine cyclo-ligase [Chromatiales bacterium (ex Bugula neritina AB1)]|nr:phosphoribosylformylglycinamidine cyclo-ligase [Chromatiales bacterium (ex Bugula neritina AB1)]